MRILVLSDSHGSTQGILRAIENQPSANILIHLGDGEKDIAAVKPQYPDKRLIQVSGNCDRLPDNCTEKTEMIHNCKIFLCHGHTYHVKSGLERLIYRAKSIGCNIALFGHTHQPMTKYCNGLYLMNPGSIGRGYPKSYGIIDITDQGIVCNTIALL